MSVILLLAGLAWADDPPPLPSAYTLLVDAGRDALVKQDYTGARRALDQAEAVAPANDLPIVGGDLGRLFFYRGVIEWRVGDRDTTALNHWRKALVIVPDLLPDATVLPETDAQDAFYALASEVKGYAQVDLALPEDLAGSVIFVDGQTHDPGDFVYVGLHYVQVRCADQSMVGSWYTFGTAPADYLVLCVGGSYGAKGRKAKSPKVEVAPAVVAATPPPTSEAPPAPTSAPPVAATSTDAVVEPVSAPLPETLLPEAVLPAGDGARSRGGHAAVTWTLLGTGAALLLGGGAVEYAVFEPVFQDVQDANAAPKGSVTPTDAATLEQRYNRARTLSFGLLGAGGLTLGTGLVVGVVDAHVALTPGGLRLYGAW